MRESQITEKKKYKFGDGIRSIKDKIKNKIDEKKERIKKWRKSKATCEKNLTWIETKRARGKEWRSKKIKRKNKLSKT